MFKPVNSELIRLANVSKNSCFSMAARQLSPHPAGTIPVCHSQADKIASHSIPVFVESFSKVKQFNGALSSLFKNGYNR